MNVLFDFNVFSRKLGCSEYARRVFFSLLDSIIDRTDVKVYALLDYKAGIAYEDMSIDALRDKYSVSFLDSASTSLSAIIEQNHIDKFFIPCVQVTPYLNELPTLKCEVIFVSHDLAYEEQAKDKIRLYYHLIDPLKSRVFKSSDTVGFKSCIKRLYSGFDRFLYEYIRYSGNLRYTPWLESIKPAIDLFRTNPSTKIVTVSEYSRNSMMYYYGLSQEDITVLYSPERVYSDHDGSLENKSLANVIATGKKYYLFVSAGRMEKNPHKTINAFRKFAQLHPDSYLVTVGYKLGKQFDNHISLPFLSDYDLSQAYVNCHALLFPSFFEGFGYPPLEAMRYGKPVLASYTTSMPEILGDAPIYFSPFYESGIFSALLSLTSENYSLYADKSLRQFKSVSARQASDLDKLVKLIA